MYDYYIDSVCNFIILLSIKNCFNYFPTFFNFNRFFLQQTGLLPAYAALETSRLQSAGNKSAGFFEIFFFTFFVKKISN